MPSRPVSRTKPITIKELAKQLGLAPSTVAQTLSGRGNTRVSESTRQRIYKAARQANYRPNGLARSLRTGRTLTVGLLMPHYLSGGTVGRRATQIEQRLAKYGYSTLIAFHHDQPAREAQAVGKLYDQKVDALIYWSSSGAGPSEQLIQLARDRFPVVVMGAETPLACPHVVVDNHHSGMLVMQHLLEQGYRAPLYVYHRAGRSTLPSDRREAYCLAYRRCFGTAASLPVLSLAAADDQMTIGIGLAAAILDHPQPVDALICRNDLVACGVMIGLIQRGRSLANPGYAMVGYEDEPFARALQPALTTIRQPVEIIAQQVVDELMALINQPEQAGVHRLVQIKSELIVRDSTRPPKPLGQSGKGS